MPPHRNQMHVLFRRHGELVFVFLSDVVEIDVSDRIIVSVCQMQVKVTSAIEINPLLTIRVMIRHWIGLKWLCFQLFLFKKKLLHNLLADIDAIHLMLFRTLHMKLFLYLRDFPPLHDYDLHLLNGAYFYMSEI